MWKLKQALQKSNSSAAGPDEVHYNLLTHIPEYVLSVLWKSVTLFGNPKPSLPHGEKQSWFP